MSFTFSFHQQRRVSWWIRPNSNDPLQSPVFSKWLFSVFVEYVRVFYDFRSAVSFKANKAMCIRSFPVPIHTWEISSGELKCLGQCHRTKKWQNGDRDPGPIGFFFFFINKPSTHSLLRHQVVISIPPPVNRQFAPPLPIPDSVIYKNTATLHALQSFAWLSYPHFQD